MKTKKNKSSQNITIESEFLLNLKSTDTYNSLRDVVLCFGVFGMKILDLFGL